MCSRTEHRLAPSHGTGYGHMPIRMPLPRTDRGRFLTENRKRASERVESVPRLEAVRSGERRPSGEQASISAVAGRHRLHLEFAALHAVSKVVINLDDAMGGPVPLEDEVGVVGAVGPRLVSEGARLTRGRNVSKRDRRSEVGAC